MGKLTIVIIDAIVAKVSAARRITMFEKSEIGVVVWIHPNGTKPYGFLHDKNGERLFFHINDAVTFFGDKSAVSWKPGVEKYPKRGDLLAFERGENSKGSIANPWGYAKNLEETRRVAAIPVNYRVVMETKFSSREFPRVTIVWEGTNLDELASEHPRTGTTMDDFRPINFSPFRVNCHFEVETEGQWEIIYDPRPLVRARKPELAVAC